MNYVSRKTMRFELGLGRTGALVIQKGDVVKGASLQEVPRSEIRNYQKAEARHRRDHPGSRLVYFHAEGVIRRAIAVNELIPTDRPHTVSVEATHE